MKWHVLPVIESGAANFSVIERKSERLDEMQLRSRGETGPPDVPGIPVDLGMDQNDVE